MKLIAIATEDELSEQVAERLTSEAGLDVSMRLRKNGNGYLRSSMAKFSTMAAHHPILVLTDLDLKRSPNQLIGEWLHNVHKPPGLLLHVAVREVEAWLLADHTGIKKLLGERIGRLPSEPELLRDPKANFLGFAAKAPRDVRSDLLAERNSMASQGLGYNARLGGFVRTIWQPSEASERSPSLAALRAELRALAKPR